MTNEQFTAWLKSPSAVRVVLMEVDVRSGGVETTRYLSNRGYTTETGETPANTTYRPIIAGGVQFTESISLEGAVSLSFGDIELINSSGELDTWLDDVWKNRAVKVFIGDMRWPRADFRQIFNGVVADISTRRNDRLNIALTDKLQRLNTPITESKVGGSGPDKDVLKPLVFGEVHNITPLLISEASHEYQVHDGSIQSIIEVRDNGVPVNFTADLLNGKFRLTSSPAGQITCSVQGDNVGGYVNDVSNIVQRITTRYGKPADRFTTADLDTANLNAFATANPQPVGIFVKDRMNVLEACAQLTKSIGAGVAMTRDGLMRLVKVALPVASTGATITSDDIINNSLQIVSRPPVVASVKLGYCKNWTVQNDLQTSIPTAHKDLFAKEWLSVTKTDEAVASEYKLFTEPSEEPTMLLTEADANTEAQRRLDLYKTQRTIFKYTALPHLLLQNLGDGLTLEHWRFGLTAGRDGQIVTLTTNWLNPRIDMEVLI